jgi:CRISP-associated protein Cas1
MIKRTLHFSTPAYLKTKDKQLVFESTESGETKKVTIANNEVVIMKQQQITIAKVLLALALLSNAIALN